MWSPTAWNGVVSRGPDDQGQVPFGEALLCGRTLVLGWRYAKNFADEQVDTLIFLCLVVEYAIPDVSEDS